MPREVKHGRRALLEEAASTGSTGGSASSSAAHRVGPDLVPFAHGRLMTARWFAALDPAAEQPVQPGRPVAGAVVAAPLVAAALAALVLLRSGATPALRTLLPLA